MTTETYINWVSKAADCGLTLEQTCGLAMLYAWNLTHYDSVDEIPDSASFWTFVDQNEFNKINEQAFNIQDFVKIAPEFRLAGEMLNVNLPIERYTEDGEPATFFNTDLQNESINEKPINNFLLFRHRFDMMWCQRIGECLRPEVRTPLHAYVFTNNINYGFAKIDPVGFETVLAAIRKNISPLAQMFTSKNLVRDLNGFEGYEPFQIALMGFTAGTDPHLGQNLWNLQKTLFYKQPSGIPVNLDKQSLPMLEFLEFISPIIDNFLSINRAQFLDLSRYIASEYIYGSISETQFAEQLLHILEERYGFTLITQKENLQQDLLMNAAAFFTLCCLKIKNLTNQIAKQPSLQMMDDKGLIWSRATTENNLLNEAIICFDVMLSWRLGPALVLLIKTNQGAVHRFYIGEFSEINDIESLFCKICDAYDVSECILSFLADNFPLKSDKPEKKFKAMFLSFSPNCVPFIDLYRVDVGIDVGFYLDEYVGQINDENIFKDMFTRLRLSINKEISYDKKKIIQAELIEDYGSPSAWGFANV